MSDKLPTIATIKIGAYASVQGPVEETLPCGQVRIRVGEQTYTGQPVKGEDNGMA